MEATKTHRHCKKCDSEKDIALFGTVKKTGLYRSYCLKCESDLAKQWGIDNPERYKERNIRKSKAYYEKNKDAINTRRKSPAFREKDREYVKEYRKQNEETIRLKARERAAKNRIKINKQASVHRLANPDRYKPYRTEYYLKNKKEISEKSKLYRKDNAEKIAECRRNRYLIDKANPLFKLEKTLRGRMISALKRGGYAKKGTTAQLLGIDYPTLKIYLERQFKDGMSWENHGEWHIDHRLPVAFAKTEQELILLFHYTNLQPLWALENITKGSKIIPHQLKIAI